MKKKMNPIITVALALALSLVCLVGCGQKPQADENGTALASGGVICLSVNPEIAIHYDEAGLVTKVEARNDDGSEIVKEYVGYEGKECRLVVGDLVTAIGEAGYFVEEVEGMPRQIVIEIESGSQLPNPEFLDEVVEEVRESANQKDWMSEVQVEGESDYGLSDYVDTDYGVGNDGVTDYNSTDYDETVTNYDDAATDYDDNSVTDYEEPVTDYGSTDYVDDSVTDYEEPVTDYGSTDYVDDSVTDYEEPVTDYGSTDYVDDSVTDYEEPVTDYGSTDYVDDSVTDYEEPVSDYDSTDYDDAASDYDD